MNKQNEMIRYFQGKHCPTVLFDRRMFEDVTPALFDLEAYESISPVTSGGRNAAWFVEENWGKSVLKFYQRGGFIAKFNKDHYFWHGQSKVRSFNEYRLLNYLYYQGVNVPKPIAAAYWSRFGMYKASLITQQIEETTTLAEKIQTSSVHDLWIPSVAQTIWNMHQAGVWHADLNAFNLLIDQEQQAWVIDFDKSKLMPIFNKQRMDNLERLGRSLKKVGGKVGVLYWHQILQNYESLLNKR